MQRQHSFDPLGRPVKTAFIGKNKSNVIETTSFTSGYYILTLEFSKGNKYYKLNKINQAVAWNYIPISF